MTNILKVSRKFGFWMAFAFVLPVLVGGYNIASALTDEDVESDVYQEHEISIEELENEYNDLDNKLLEEEEENKFLESFIPEEAIILDDNGLVTLDETKLSNVPNELIYYFEDLVDTRNENLIDGSYIDDDGDMVYNEVQFEVQSASFRLVGSWRTVWGIKFPIGWDLQLNGYAAAIVVGLLIAIYGVVNLIRDISQLWKNRNSIVSSVGKVSSHLAGVVYSLAVSLSRLPVWLLNVIELTWKVLTSGNPLMTAFSFVANIAMPSLNSGIQIFQNGSYRRGSTLEYTLFSFDRVRTH